MGKRAPWTDAYIYTKKNRCEYKVVGAVFLVTTDLSASFPTRCNQKGVEKSHTIIFFFYNHSDIRTQKSIVFKGL